MYLANQALGVVSSRAWKVVLYHCHNFGLKRYFDASAATGYRGGLSHAITCFGSARRAGDWRLCIYVR
jgi:hypothetical protein